MGEATLSDMVTSARLWSMNPEVVRLKVAASAALKQRNRAPWEPLVGDLRMHVAADLWDAIASIKDAPLSGIPAQVFGYPAVRDVGLPDGDCVLSDDPPVVPVPTLDVSTPNPPGEGNDTPVHVHSWQPAGIHHEEQFDGRIRDWIYALCACGVTNKFVVRGEW